MWFVWRNKKRESNRYQDIVLNGKKPQKYVRNSATFIFFYLFQRLGEKNVWIFKQAQKRHNRNKEKSRLILDSYSCFRLPSWYNLKCIQFAPDAYGKKVQRDIRFNVPLLYFHLYAFATAKLNPTEKNGEIIKLKTVKEFHIFFCILNFLRFGFADCSPSS